MGKNTLNYILMASIVLNLFMGFQLYTISNNSFNESNIIEANPDETTEDILFIGDSIIESAPWDQILKNRHIVNKAMPGITSTDAVMMSNELIPTKPKKVFIMLGVNDIKSKVPMNITLRNIGHFVYTIKRFSPKTTIYLLSVLPVNEKHDTYKIKNDHVKGLNYSIKEFCTRFNFNYIDLYNVLLDSESNLDDKYTNDGLHINSAAHQKLGEQLKKYIN